MTVSSRRELALEGIQKLQTATAKAVPLKNSDNPEVRELAEAVHLLAFGAQEIGLALTDQGRTTDFPW